jgi:hypothetical protein
VWELRFWELVSGERLDVLARRANDGRGLGLFGSLVLAEHECHKRRESVDGHRPRCRAYQSVRPNRGCRVRGRPSSPFENRQQANDADSGFHLARPAERSM